MRQGFTLIELLVVISIVSLLSSIGYASAATVRVKARDSARIQQVRQIDTAVNLYTSSNDHAPFLDGTCSASSGGGTALCVARSTADPNSNQGRAWSRFISDITPFIPGPLQPDPCGASGCESATPDENTGYVYVAPAAMASPEVCGYPCSRSTSELNNSYQLFTTLERYTFPQGFASFASFYDPYSSAPVPAPTVSLQVTTLYYAKGQPIQLQIQWTVFNATSCIGNDGTGIGDDGPGPWNNTPLDPSGGTTLFTYPFGSTPAHFATVTCTGPGGSGFDTYGLP